MAHAFTFFYILFCPWDITHLNLHAGWPSISEGKDSGQEDTGRHRNNNVGRDNHNSNQITQAGAAQTGADRQPIRGEIIQPKQTDSLGTGQGGKESLLRGTMSPTWFGRQERKHRGETLLRGSDFLPGLRMLNN